MGVHPLPRTGLIGAVAFLVAWLVTTSAWAAPPPFDLVRTAVAEARQKQKSVVLDLSVTQTSGQLVEWRLSGAFDIGEVPKRLAGEDVALTLLWVVLLSADPVTELQTRYGLINAARATVGVQEEFVYVYGSIPALSVFRDLKRVAALSVEASGHRWVIRTTWSAGVLTGAMVTRDGRTVLAARHSQTRPSRETP